MTLSSAQVHKVGSTSAYVVKTFGTMGTLLPLAYLAFQFGVCFDIFFNRKFWKECMMMLPLLLVKLAGTINYKVNNLMAILVFNYQQYRF
jgi:hypothetical protein